MNTKNKVLSYLENHKNQYVSGKTLALEMNVSRTAIWKHIHALKYAGYDITAQKNMGYSLSEYSNHLSTTEITTYLNNPKIAEHLHLFETLPSTNQKAKELALKNAPNNTIILANEQTEGKGKKGKPFFSLAHTGIYMSVLIRPNITIYESTLLTAATAVAVCRAIEQTTDCNPQIKWINDIFINEKKICGILTEAETDFENGSVEHIIIGIGINISTDISLFPPDIKEIAGSLSDSAHIPYSRNKLIAEIMNELLIILADFEKKTFVKDYQERSFLTNRYINLTQNNKTSMYKVLGIDEECRLIVEDSNSNKSTLTTGEITILPISTTHKIKPMKGK